MGVVIRAVPLYSISDHIARGSTHTYGALTGHYSGEDIIVSGAFELKTDSHEIDLTFLHKRLSLIQTVSPAARWIGIYSTAETDQFPDQLLAQLQREHTDVPPLFLAPRDGSFECIDPQTGDKLPFVLAPGESEVIATSTVQNHPNYTQEESEVSQETEASLAQSLQQLEEKVKEIIAYSGPVLPERDRQLVHLATLLTKYKGTGSTEDHQLLTSHLCLLGNQIAAVNSAKVQVNRQISRMMSLPLPYARDRVMGS